MKTLFLLPILSLSLLSTSCWGVDWDDLVERDYIYYKKFTETPFTGKVSGRKQGEMKNGIKEGEWVEYYEDGQLSYKGRYKNGEELGEWVLYYANGQLKEKGSFGTGRFEGEYFTYHANGQLKEKGSFKNGKKDGEWVNYDENWTVME